MARGHGGQSLLFPGRDGGPHSSSCLDGPFERVSKSIGLPFVATARAMRWTCNDLQRAADVDTLDVHLGKRIGDPELVHDSEQRQGDTVAGCLASSSLVALRW